MTARAESPFQGAPDLFVRSHSFGMISEDIQPDLNGGRPEVPVENVHPDERSGLSDRRQRLVNVSTERRHSAGKRVGDFATMVALADRTGLARIPSFGLESVRDVPPLSAYQQYSHTKVKMMSSLDTIGEARALQYISYKASRFVDESAKTPEGYLKPEIDTSLIPGADLDFYMAYHPYAAHDEDSTKLDATMRVFNLSPGQDYTGLPTAKYLSPAGQNILSQVDSPVTKLKEIAGLALRPGADQRAMHEVIRSAIHGALGKNEVWFFCIVSSTYRALMRQLGEKNFTTIDEAVHLDKDGIKTGVSLIPTILYPDKFVDVILETYETTENPIIKAKLKDKFLFYSDGLSLHHMSPHAYIVRQGLLTELGEKEASGL